MHAARREQLLIADESRVRGAAGVGLYLVLALCCVQWAGVALWTLGQPAPRALVPLILVLLAGLGLARAGGPGRRDCARALIAAGVLLAVALAIMRATYDLSYDGQAYHQGAMLALLQGWRAGQPAPVDASNARWIEHYPAASWLVGAAWASALNHLEAARVQNLLWCVASVLLTREALRPMPGVGDASRWLTAAVVGANPVVIAQLLSNYNDGLLYSVLVVAVAAGLIGLRTHRPLWRVTAALALCFAANLKFTGLIYAAITVAGAGVALWWSGQRAQARRVALGGLLSLALAVLLLGWHPYVSNLLERGHPFWPLFGAGKVDIMSMNTPDLIAQAGPWQRWWMANLSLPVPLSSPPNYFWRGELRAESVAVMGGADCRIGGFGLLYPLVLCLLVPGLAWAGVARLRGVRLARGGLLLVIAVLAVPVLINPQNWWARYVPQQWAVTAGLLLLLASLPQPALRRLGVAGLVLLALNAAVAVAATTRAQVRGTQAWQATLHELKAQSAAHALSVDLGDQIGIAARLREAGVRFQPRAEPGCPTGRNPLPAELAYLGSLRICEPDPSPDPGAAAPQPGAR